MAHLEICGLRTQRRSGPGGQHRNKTSSGAFLHYPPTNTTAEATERRSQSDNRRIALERLRFRLAVEVRSPSPIDGHEIPSEEDKLRKQYGSVSEYLIQVTVADCVGTPRTVGYITYK